MAITLRTRLEGAKDSLGKAQKYLGKNSSERKPRTALGFLVEAEAQVERVRAQVEAEMLATARGEEFDVNAFAESYGIATKA